MPWGRIIKALSGFYYVLESGEKQMGGSLLQCRARGIFRKEKVTPLVGDLVRFERTGAREGWIEEIAARKNELIRPPIANLDLAVLLFSLKKPDLNLPLLDRYLAYIEFHRIPIHITLTKSDLVDEGSWERTQKRYEKIGYPVTLTSVKEGRGIEEIHQAVEGKLSVFAGQSGVGKSSLLNALIPGRTVKTGEISEKLGRGKHTTRHVELLFLNEESMIADTPGFGQIDLNEIKPTLLSACFPEMRERKAECRFRECLHLQEPGCAVRDAVETGEVSKERYAHYLLFLQEIKQYDERRYH